MTTKRIHFPSTTFQQRRLLFETWEQTKNVEEACQKAHVGKSTFYNWKPRFDQDGYAGLKDEKKRGRPIGSGRTALEIRSQVIELHKAHKDWGKRRLSDEMAKANNWVPLVSPNSVRRILREAGYWKPEERKGKKKAFSPMTRTADYPGQAVNVDLLFVPLSHEVDIKLPAVSGSSGHLVIERLPEEG
jgi:transposase